jgi:hypothetical protein
MKIIVKKRNKNTTVQIDLDNLFWQQRKKNVECCIYHCNTIRFSIHYHDISSRNNRKIMLIDNHIVYRHKACEDFTQKERKSIVNCSCTKQKKHRVIQYHVISRQRYIYIYIFNMKLQRRKYKSIEQIAVIKISRSLLRERGWSNCDEKTYIYFFLLCVCTYTSYTQIIEDFI